MSKYEPKFSRTSIDADGYGILTTRSLTPNMTHLCVWRAARSDWRWSVVSRDAEEIPADSHHKNVIAAIKAAQIWWNRHGENGVRRIYALRLGERVTLLANTSAETTLR